MGKNEEFRERIKSKIGKLNEGKYALRTGLGLSEEDLMSALSDMISNLELIGDGLIMMAERYRSSEDPEDKAAVGIIEAMVSYLDDTVSNLRAREGVFQNSLRRTGSSSEKILY